MPKHMQITFEGTVREQKIHTRWLVSKKARFIDDQGVGVLRKYKILLSAMMAKLKRNLAVAYMVNLSIIIVT